MIATEVSKKRYLGNDATTIFPYTFRIDAAADLTVIIADAVDIQTVLVLDVDYTVSGVGVETGGNVTYPIAGAPLPLGSSITIYRHLDILQSTNFINQGEFYAETHESTFDTVVMLIQQMQEQLDRTFKVTSTSGDNGDDVYAEILEAEINALASEVAAAASEAAAAASEAAAASSAAEAAAPISFLQGAIEETVDLNITEAGGVVYAQIQAEGGGDLKIYFSTGAYTFDSTPAAIVALAAGTDTVPKLNYVYILESTKALTANITGWPTAEHAPLGTMLVQTAASVAADGAYKVHAWVDHLTDSNEQGHLSHLNRWIREQHATWISGVTPTLTITVIGGSDTVIFTSTVGEIMQLHPHDFPAFTGTPDIYVINDNVTPYNKITDINQLTAYSDGVAISNNERFSIVIMGIVNENTGDCKLILSLPSGGYNTDGLALDDLQGYTNYSIPNDFKGTAFLIAKYTLRYLTADSGTFSKVAGGDVDLRGFLPSIIAGGGTSGGISDSIIDAKGDIITGTADNTPIVKSVGTDDQVVSADSGEADGLIWRDVGFVDRGDPSAYDLVLASMTTDGTWYDWDVSSVVPAGAKAVMLGISMKDNTVDKYLQFRKNGNVNTYAAVLWRTQAANVTMGFEIIVACDSNRIIEYSASNTTFTFINIVILGWFL